MPKKGLLITGIALVVLSLVGSLVQGGVSENLSDRGWFGHMFEDGHMFGGFGQTRSEPSIDGAEEITVVATNFAFEPPTIKVTEGSAVNVRLDNQGTVPHDLTVPELGLRVVASPGQEAVAGITDLQPGIYEMLCTYPGHADAGMTGTFVVEPDEST